MAELLKRVLHHLEGEEVTQHEAWFSGDDKPRTVTVKTCGTERWIRRVHERQVLTAFDAIALIHMAVVDYFDFPSEEQEQALVDGWALELIKSAQAKEFIARDPFTFLPFGGDFESLEWGLLMSDADSFLAARDMKWTFSELAQRVYDEEFRKPANQLLKAGDGQAAAEPVQTDSRPANDKKKKLPWEILCEEQRDDVYLAQIASGKAAPKDWVAQELAGRCKVKGYVTKHGKPVLAKYIERHALNGWKLPELS
jgi:hypothetical protein